ncbi:MAG: hypothetical protein J2P22_09750 [Nocardioides sp.]|nr:hypothetical protein [Nocardioides sp.]
MSDPYSPDAYDLRDGPESSSPSFREGLHPVNIGHLVMGVAFAGLTIIWALFISDTVQGHDLRWLLPIPWVAAGVAGLVAAAPRMRGSRD